MRNFVFQNATKIVFGRGTEAETGRLVRQYADRVLLHYGGGSIKASGLYDRLMRSLSEAGVSVVELGGVQPNPRLSLVREGIELCRKENLRFILAAGGGSVIDSAKAIAIGVDYDGDVWDFFSKGAKPKTALPIGVVLTIPAAGSESSSSAVITKEDGMLKYSVGSDLIRPQFAVMNPELTCTLPPYQTVCGASDIMAHVMERYFTQEPDVDFSDRLCESTLQTIIKHVPIVLREPDNYAARAEIMWAGTVAHNDLLSAGRVGDWGSHLIEHELSALYDVAHGAGLSVVFPAWMRYVYRQNVTRFVQFATRVFGVEPDLWNPEATALEGISRLTAFYRSVGLPVTLSELGVPSDRLPEMAKRATSRGKLGNFMKLGEEDVLAILNLAKGE